MFPWIAGAVALGCLLARWLNPGTPFSNFTHLTPTHLRIDGLFFGALLGYLHTFYEGRFMDTLHRYRTFLQIGGIAAFVPAFFLEFGSSRYLQVFGLAAHWLGAGALLGVALTTPASDGWFVRSLAYLGQNSYGTYLWHFWLGRYAMREIAVQFLFVYSWPVYLLIYFLGSFALGSLTTFLFERPFLWLRELLAPSGHRQATLPVPLTPAPALAPSLT